MTAKNKIKNRILETGSVDNFWCIDNKVTTRLGAVILVLRRKEGMIFDGKYGKELGKPRELHKNFYYTHLNAPKKETYVIVGNKDNKTIELPI